MSEYSNIADIEAMLNALDGSIDFTRHGEDRSLGYDVIRDQATRINDRAMRERGCEGRFAPNRGEYAKAKKELSLIIGRGMETPDGSPDVMMSLLNTQGEQHIGRDEVTMTFGVTPDAKDKGNWFTYGSFGPLGLRSGAKKQRERPFYAITKADAEKIFAQVIANIVAWIKTL